MKFNTQWMIAVSSLLFSVVANAGSVNVDAKAGQFITPEMQAHFHAKVQDLVGRVQSIAADQKYGDLELVKLFHPSSEWPLKDVYGLGRSANTVRGLWIEVENAIDTTRVPESNTYKFTLRLKEGSRYVRATEGEITAICRIVIRQDTETGNFAGMPLLNQSACQILDLVLPARK